ncbi:MAG: cytochrome-c peroxidase [Sphingobacteriales bacterium]|nr:MAG: cytochrome-c peroxidase [Sphingobacteriales bacterium]TAF81964.1 MAG: cytochrome-c peroxidase [Sphingobacteriales bacterium]
MLKKILFFCLFIIVISCTKNENKSFESLIHTDIEEKIDTLNLALNELVKLKDTKKIKISFFNSRNKYKKIEPFVEYYFQGLARRINGPALPEIKTDDNIVNEASGYQVIEEIICNDSIDYIKLTKEVNILKTDLNFIKQTFKDLPVQNHHFYELIQHQIIRIATLGITGFDSPVAFNSISEAQYSIIGIVDYYTMYGNTNQKKHNQNFIYIANNAIKYLIQNPKFDSFNRLVFIKNYLMPLSVALENDFKLVIYKTPHFTENKVFYGHLADLMQGKKINPDAFSPYAESKSTKQKKTLGKVLFNNKSLSLNNTLSCASCHHADNAFTDGNVTSGINVHSNSVMRNSPTLLYSSFQKSYFFDLRSQDLENQIESVMKNPDEFNLSPKEINNRLLKNNEIMQMFKNAYPNKKEITPYEVRNAIASYVRSLMPFSSKIDKYFQNKAILTAAEINGFNIFTGKGKCASCHFIPLYNGTVPPWFNNTESEVIGVPKSVAWKNAVVDTDEGRYNVNQIEELKFSFKTPTVRNIEKTAPYMHNGIYTTLVDVIKFYELGGGNGIGMKLKHQTLPFDNLKLSVSEKSNIISFLKTLTDE